MNLKKTKRSSARFKSAFYTRILQVIGVFGTGFILSCKYGSPVADYGVVANYLHFHGTIKSEDSLIRIPGLQVRLVSSNWGDSLNTVTNSTGDYSFDHNAMEGEIFSLKVHDPDSAANEGDFKDLTVSVQVSSRDVKNREHQTDVLMQKK